MPQSRLQGHLLHQFIIRHDIFWSLWFSVSLEDKHISYVIPFPVVSILGGSSFFPRLGLQNVVRMGKKNAGFFSAVPFDNFVGFHVISPLFISKPTCVPMFHGKIQVAPIFPCCLTDEPQMPHSFMDKTMIHLKCFHSFSNV